MNREMNLLSKNKKVSAELNERSVLYIPIPCSQIKEETR